MNEISSQAIGVAGVHYVASRISAMGFNVAQTIRNAKHVDLLVGSPKTMRAISVQVKTSKSAARGRGKGKNREILQYEFEIGWPCAQCSHKDLLFALADLGGYFDDPPVVPTVFWIPSHVIRQVFKVGNPQLWRRAILKKPVAWFDDNNFRENWNLIKQTFR